MKITFLGTGSSTGIPVPACSCDVCQSLDPRNKRLRPSVLIEHQGIHLLIDIGPDFRTQMLREKVQHLEALLFTHAHFDHIAGLDDIKPYTVKEPLPLYGNSATYSSLKQSYPYNFGSEVSSGSSIPQLIWHTIEPLQPFSIKGIEIFPLPLQHGSWQPLGYRVGDVAYLLDCKSISEKSLSYLQDLDVLVLTGLRREKEHPNHMTFAEALPYIEQLKPKRALFSHMEHKVDHATESALLPKGVGIAYDGLILEVTPDRWIVQSEPKW